MTNNKNGGGGTMSENTVIKIPEDTFSSGVYDAKIALGVLHLIVKW